MTHPTQAGIGLVRMGESSFVPANPEDDLCGKDVENFCDVTLVNVVPGNQYEKFPGGVAFSSSS